MRVLVKGCARCGDDHDLIFERLLGGPIGDMTHWSECPQFRQPILMKIVSDDEPAQARAERAEKRTYELEAALQHIARFPIHSEPVGAAYAMQDIAEEVLKGGGSE